MKDFVYDDFSKYRQAQVEKFGIFEGQIPRWVEGQERFIKSWMARYPRETRILDVACGDGVGLRVLAEMGFKNVVGVDFSPEKASRARARGHSVHEIDMHDLGIFPAASFDVIYSSHSLEHALDPDKVLKEFRRTLSAEGHVVLVLPYPDKGEREKHCAKHILGSDRNDDAKALTAYLDAAGFEILEKAYDSFREVEVWLRLRPKP